MTLDYDFEPPLERMTSLMHWPMLKRSARSDHTATLMLNIFAMAATHPGDAGENTGRILITPHILHTLAYPDSESPRKWILEFNSEAPHSPKGFLLVYRDLSCLIAVIDDEQSKKMRMQVVEVLPIPLHIPERNRAADDPDQIRFRGGPTGGPDVELCVQGIGKNVPLFSTSCAQHVHVGPMVIESARVALLDGAAAWSAAFQDLPYLRQPKMGEPRLGVFDLTIPAPRPELSGRPFSWPVMLSWSDTTPGQEGEFQSYLTRAANYLMARHPNHISALRVRVWAGRPTKPLSKPKVELRANLLRVRETAENDIEQYRLELEELLRDPRAPFDFSERQGSEVVQLFTKNNKRRIVSQPQRLGYFLAIEPLSAHAQIEAIADFS